MADLRDKRVDLVLQQLEELPTLPAVAARVLAATADDASSAADVVRLIGSDPALTARILQLTRRADRGVRDEVRSVDRAVVLLGFDAVRNAVLAVSVFQALGPPADDPDGGASGGAPVGTGGRRVHRDEFWKHCLAVACCAELLAERGHGGGAGGGGGTPSDAFLCGLLHDLGKIALDAALPKSYARVAAAADLLRGDIADLERTVIGVDHLVAGKRLAERWQLPAAVRDAAWLHNTPPDALPAGVRGRLVNLVTLADLLVRRQHLGYSGNHAYPVHRDVLLSAVGLTPADADHAVAHVVARMEPRLAALGIGDLSGDDLYRQALARANAELGHVSGQLAAKAKRLTARTQFFDALRDFQTTLRPDASPQQVLAAVARTAAGIVGAEAAAGFSLAPGQDFAEAVLCDAGGAVTEAVLVELPGMSGLTEPDPVSDEELRAVGALPPTAPGSPAAPPRVPPGSGGAPDRIAPATTGPAAEPLGSRAPSIPLVPSGSLPAPARSPGDNPVLPAGDPVGWLTGGLAAKLPAGDRVWVCLASEGVCVGGVVWAAASGEPARLAPQARELNALADAWALALRMSQAREVTRSLAEGLADANRRLLATRDAVLRTRALTVVGEMAAGAAHEMNNPLAVISGRSQLLARTLSDEKQRAAAALVHEQSERLSDIITEMMAFAKPQPPRPQACDLGSLITAALTRAKARTEPADRSIEVTVAGVVPAVAADPGQVAEALAEVLDNALQATHPQSGRIVVRAAHDPWGNRAVVTVADNGCGMDAAALARAFDPFFSSKPAGRRRGLGLAKALRWVEAGGGSVRLESRPGGGTTAVVLLPTAAAGAAAVGPT